jgi:hypothetical protein
VSEKEQRVVDLERELKEVREALRRKGSRTGSLRRGAMP